MLFHHLPLAATVFALTATLACSSHNGASPDPNGVPDTIDEAPDASAPTDDATPDAPPTDDASDSDDAQSDADASPPPAPLAASIEAPEGADAAVRCSLDPTALDLSLFVLSWSWTLNGQDLDHHDAELPADLLTHCDLLTCQITLQGNGEARLSEVAARLLPLGPDCDDGEPCTTEACREVGGCGHEPNTLACDDGNICTQGDVCAQGTCQPGPAQNCADGQVCNGTETCDPSNGCQPGPAPELPPGATCFADDLMLHWRFDAPHPHNAVEHDASGHSRDGLMLWSRTRQGGGAHHLPDQGVIGGAGALADRGTIVARDTMTLPETWSLGIWLRPTQATRHDDIINLLTEDNQSALRISQNNNRFYIFNSVDGTQRTLAFAHDGQGWDAEQWSHITVVYDAAGIAFYLNGQPLTPPADQAHVPWDPDLNVTLRLTGQLGLPHNRFRGPIDELHVYGTPLTDADAAALADLQSSTYGDAQRRPIADAGEGYTAWLQDGRATTTMAGGLMHSHDSDAQTTYLWEVHDAPDGAQVTFDDPTDPHTQAHFTVPGPYVLRLTAFQEGFGDTAQVNAAIFEPEGTPPATTFHTQDPFTPLMHDRIEPERVERTPQGAMPLLAHWSFDEGEGDEAQATGLEPSSVNIGTNAWSPDGRRGAALHVSPTEAGCQEVDFGGFEALSGEFSLSFWVRSQRTDGDASFFRATGSASGTYWTLSNQTHSDTHSRVTWSPSHATGFWRHTDAWNHIVITHSPGWGMRKLYIDGQMAGAIKFTAMGQAQGNGRLWFGSTDSRCFKGLLDDVALFGTTLNNEEVWALYNGDQSPDTLTERLPEDPYKTGGYRRAFIDEHFPDPTPTQLNQNFRDDRFGPGQHLPPYEHPRLLFTRQELPTIRARSKSRDGSRILAELRQYTAAMALTQLDERGQYIVQAHLNERDQFTSDTVVEANIVAEAYLALIEADWDKARKVIAWMMDTAEVQRRALDVALGQSNDWRNVFHWIVQRRGTALLYDWMYPWMTPDERATIRSILADATAGHWSIGINAVAGLNANTSNWQNWVTGEYFLALSAIHGEDGFDPVTFEAAERAVKHAVLVYGDETSGAFFEGTGKATITTGTVAVLSRTQAAGQRLLSSALPYNTVRRFAFHHLTPWGTEIFRDETLGGLGELRLMPIRMMHFAYPDDPILNYLKHASEAGTRYGVLHLRNYTPDSHLMTAPYGQDWTGPQDLGEHLQEAAAAADEPLGYFSNYRGMMVGRSDWTTDAAQLFFQPRSLRGGHAMPARGYISFNALGRTWVPFYGWHTTISSRFHSIVTVDGQGQDVTPARVLFYDGAQNQPGLAVDIMGADLTGPYRHAGQNSLPSLNAARLEPDTERPWMSLDTRHLVDWYLGDRPAPHVPPSITVDFEHAHRSSALVRGPHPYALVMDDIKKDDQVRQYNWGLTMPMDVFEAQAYDFDGHTATYHDPLDPTRHFMVVIFDSNAPGSFDASVETQGRGDARKINFRTQATAERFRALLYPYRDGDPLPSVTGNNGRYTITIGAQTDTLDITTDGNGVHRRITLERGGQTLVDVGAL